MAVLLFVECQNQSKEPTFLEGAFDNDGKAR